VMEMEKGMSKVWVLYLLEQEREVEVPVAVGGGGPPSSKEREVEAARARAALNFPEAKAVLRTLPLLCHQGTLYAARELIFPGTEDCARFRRVRPGEVIRLY